MKRKLFARAEGLLVAERALLALIVDVQHALVNVPLMIVKTNAASVLGAAVFEPASDYLERAHAYVGTKCRLWLTLGT